MLEMEKKYTIGRTKMDPNKTKIQENDKMTGKRQVDWNN